MIDNISQATLDVIEAIKTKQTIKFNYGMNIVREVTPTGFFGDFDDLGQVEKLFLGLFERLLQHL